MRVLLKQLVIIKLVSKNKKQKIKTQSLPEPGWRRVWVGAESLPKNKNRKCKKRKEVGKDRDGRGRGRGVTFWVEAER